MIKIKKELCKGCNICVSLCPLKNLELKDGVISIKDQDKCTKCKMCERYCPEGGIEIE